MSCLWGVLLCCRLMGKIDLRMLIHVGRSVTQQQTTTCVGKSLSLSGSPLSK